MRKQRTKPRATEGKAASSPGTPAVGRRELVLVLAVVTAGIGLRLWSFSRSAVEHFDEGVYSSNIYFGAPDYAYPQQRFFGPPLLPALIEAGMIVRLPPNLAALLPSFLAGCATIVALWWFGRSWFGPEAGLSAATLAALSDFHVIYSATALTDVLLGLWLVLALDAIARSLMHGDYRWAVGAGIYTGLAWWTKYNGWLPLAIEAAALPILWLVLRPPPRDLTQWLLCLAVTAIVAALVWSPYFFSLQLHGGYAPIAANHAKYFVGFAGWPGAASRQICSQFAIETWQSAAAIAAALALPALLGREDRWTSVWRGGICISVGLLAIFWTSAMVAIAGSLIGIVRLLIARRQRIQSANWQQATFGLGLLMAWWGGLLVVTPCYTAYPRLALPLLLASWLGFGLNTLPNLQAGKIWPGRWQGALHSRIFGIAILISLFLIPALFFPHRDHFLQSDDRCGVLRIARQVHETHDLPTSRVIYVYGEPAMFFQLRAAGEEFVAPVQDVPIRPATIENQSAPTFLIVGPHAERDPEFQRQWSAAQDRWRLTATYDYVPSSVVWLDLHDPRMEAGKLRDTKHEFRVYELQTRSDANP